MTAAKETLIKPGARRLKQWHPCRHDVLSSVARTMAMTPGAQDLTDLTDLPPCARRCKYAEPVAAYTCDVLMPTGLYGPLYLWLLRKGREQLIYRTLHALRII